MKKQTFRAPRWCPFVGAGERLEAAMGVHQCVFFVCFHDRGGWRGRGSWTGCSGGSRQKSRGDGVWVLVGVLRLSRCPSACGSVEKTRRRRGSVTWVGEVRRRRRRKAHQGTEWQQESHSRERGPVYELPCPHSPHNKPGLLSVRLVSIDRYIYRYIYIDILTLFCLFFQL